MISRAPRKPFPSPTPFLFFSHFQTVKYSKYHDMRKHFCNFCMNCVKFLQKYESKLRRRYKLIYTICKIIYDEFIVMTRPASLRSAADRRNSQNTVTEFPDLHTENRLPKFPGNLFPAHPRFCFSVFAKL
jgi:hypothetical protein